MGTCLLWCSAFFGGLAVLGLISQVFDPEPDLEDDEE